jgi:hypothetical protein
MPVSLSPALQNYAVESTSVSTTQIKLLLCQSTNIQRLPEKRYILMFKDLETLIN